VPSPKSGKSSTGGTKYGGGSHGNPGAAVSYSEVDAGALLGAIIAVTDSGDAITFGRTAEGGAYYVGILSEGLLEKFYLDSSKDAQDALRRVEQVARQ
jgi:hypothetical protein